MAIRDGHIDAQQFSHRVGDDSPPIMNVVPEPPPSHWGKLTSRGRTASVSYLLFVVGNKNKEVRDGK